MTEVNQKNRKPDGEFDAVNSEALNISEWEWIDAGEVREEESGNGSVVSFIEENAADDTLLVFPPGTYSFDSGAEVVGVESFGIMCPGGRATFTEGEIGEGGRFLTLGSSTDPVDSVFVSGIETDTVQAKLLEIYGSGLIEDIRFTAEKGVSDVDTTYHISARVLDEAKSLTFRNVRMPEGGTYGEPLNDAAGGWYIHDDTAGTVNFIDCEASGFPNNGIYASPPGEEGGQNGRIRVEGGRFIDNNVAGVRIGGDSSVVRDATFRFEDPDPDFEGVRGVYARNGSGHQIENNRFETEDGVSTVDQIRVTSECRSVSLTDNFHRDDGGVRVLRVSPSDESDRENRVIVSGMEMRGDASDEEYPIFIERDHTKLDNLVAVQPNRSAMWIDADDCVLKNEDIEVGGNEVLDQGERTIRNGVSVNEGDPSTEGVWSGFETLAYERGVSIWNSNESPQIQYRASPNGEYVRGLSENDEIESLITEGAEGTAPVSQGDGSLAMQEVGAGGDGYEQPEDGTFDINLEP